MFQGAFGQMHIAMMSVLFFLNIKKPLKQSNVTFRYYSSVPDMATQVQFVMIYRPCPLLSTRAGTVAAILLYIFYCLRGLLVIRLNASDYLIYGYSFGM